jgi:succinate dehydrogenase / fumarate reductase flavoprotein subunit
VRDQVNRFLSTKGTRTVDWFHRELGKIMWENCGMARTQASLEKAISEIPALREEFEKDVRVLGGFETLNQSLEKVGRVADFFELGELICRDALHREESCGGHFRVEHQTEEGEALRDDERFAYVAGWEWGGAASTPVLHKEPLEFENVQLAQRSYK